jgi:hypothetical protein
MKPFQVVAVILFCALAAAQISSEPAAPSFEAFGLRSGMSAEEVSRKFPTYELRWLASPKGSAMLLNRPVNPENPDIFASLAFCQNRLMSVIRNIDPDNEFLGYVQDYIREYGQPEVKVTKNPWTGLNGGDITDLELTWTRNGVRRKLSLVPEGRTGSGELRYVRTATAAAFLDRPCKE